MTSLTVVFIAIALLGASLTPQVHRRRAGRPTVERPDPRGTNGPNCPALGANGRHKKGSWIAGHPPGGGRPRIFRTGGARLRFSRIPITRCAGPVLAALP